MVVDFPRVLHATPESSVGDVEAARYVKNGFFCFEALVEEVIARMVILDIGGATSTLGMTEILCNIDSFNAYLKFILRESYLFFTSFSRYASFFIAPGV